MARIGARHRGGGNPVYPFPDFRAARRAKDPLRDDGHGSAHYTGGGTSMPTEIERARRLFTVDEYDRMAAAGIFRPGDRVELIDGEVVEMTPIGLPHSATVAALTRLLAIGVAERGVVWVQSPVVIPPYSEPEPDVTVLRARSYRETAPGPDDVLLIVEVADTSLRYDQTVKRGLYARAGIREYWIVDTSAETVDVFHSPGSTGYAETRRIARDGTITPSAFPDVAVRVADLFV